MKKTIVFICAATLLVSTAFPKNKNLPPKELEREVKQIVLLTDLNSQVTKELIEGHLPEMAVECREGTELPFKYMGKFFGLFSVPHYPSFVNPACQPDVK